MPEIHGGGLHRRRGGLRPQRAVDRRDLSAVRAAALAAAGAAVLAADPAIR